MPKTWGGNWEVSYCFHPWNWGKCVFWAIAIKLCAGQRIVLSIRKEGCWAKGRGELRLYAATLAPPRHAHPPSRPPSCAAPQSSGRRLAPCRLTAPGPISPFNYNLFPRLPPPANPDKSPPSHPYSFFIINHDFSSTFHSSKPHTSFLIQNILPKPPPDPYASIFCLLKPQINTP